MNIYLIIYKCFLRLLSETKTFCTKFRPNINLGEKSLVFYRTTILNNGGKIEIGNSCRIGRSKKECHAGMPFYTTLYADGKKSAIKIGDSCRINGAYIHARDFISIGEKTVIATGVSIIDSNAHETKSLDRTKGTDTPKGIIIGKNVWIGLNVIILKGTTIGDNSVIAAGSVVKGTFPENVIIQGNPAVIVNKLI